MSELLKINVNQYTEKKNGLTYLSWADAWAEVLKIDPQADWTAVEFPQPDGTVSPCMYVGKETAMVKTAVTIKGKTRTCLLPVMDHRNKAIPSPDAFAINTAIMRCMTKAISMHGLGLYIYAGEDLPESDEPEAKPKIPESFRSSPTMGAMDELPTEEQDYIRDLAMAVLAEFSESGNNDSRMEMVRRVESEQLDDSQKTALWSLLDAKTRSAFKKIQAAMRETA